MRITAQSMARTNYLAYKMSTNSSNFRSGALSSILGDLSSSTNASASNMYELAAQFNSFKVNRSSLKAYYGNTISGVDSSGTAGSLTSNSAASSSADTTAAKALSSAAAELNTAAAALSTTGNKSLFRTDGDGGYDMDAIAEAVTDFVDSYNSAKKAVVDSGNSKAIQTAVSMVSGTAAVESTLNKIGITIGSDNTLSLNADTLRSADVADIKSLFNGTGSYAYGVAKQAAQINGYANADIQSKYAGYSSVGSIIDMLA